MPRVNPNKVAIGAVLLVANLAIVATHYLRPAARPAAATPAVAPAGAVPVAETNLSVHFSPKGGCTDALVHEIDAAAESLHVQAYSFTSAALAQAVIRAEKRGVAVVLILDKSQRGERYSSLTFFSNEHLPVHVDSVHAIAHNKVMLIDGKTVCTGSFNFTKAAENENAENLLVIHDAAKLCAQYEENFQKHLEHSPLYTPAETP